METITKIATFMHTADKAFWHEKIATNRYLATLSVLFALFEGIVTPEAHRGVRQWLADSFLEWGIFSSLLAAIGMLVVLVVLNIGESIISTGDFVSRLMRSLWVTLVISIAFLLGLFGGKVAIVILILMMVILLIEMLLSLASATRKAFKPCK